MTDEEWGNVHKKLCNGFGTAELLIDGYNITLITQPEGDLKYIIGVYINGKMRSDWFNNDCEERRRFFCQRKKLLVSNQKLAHLKISEKKRKEIRERNTYYYYEPYWRSFNSMKRHFLKNNTDIRLKLYKD